jgi:hypothetical protein
MEPIEVIAIERILKELGEPGTPHLQQRPLESNDAHYFTHLTGAMKFNLDDAARTPYLREYVCARLFHVYQEMRAILDKRIEALRGQA